MNSSSTPNHSGPTRSRSMKQRNNASASSNGGIPQHQTPAGQGVEVPPNNPSPKEHSHRSAFGSQSHSSNDHPQQRNSFRNRNGGPHPRGDGSHHHNYGGRHQDRGSQDWNNHRNFNNRDNHIHPQRVVPRAMRPPHQAPAPPNAPPFIPQPPIRSFAGPIGFGKHCVIYKFNLDAFNMFIYENVLFFRLSTTAGIPSTSRTGSPSAFYGTTTAAPDVCRSRFSAAY